MLPKSQRRAYVGFDDRPKAIKYYNAATRNILLSRNYRFLEPKEFSPPEAIAIDSPMSQGEHTPSREGEVGGSTGGSSNTRSVQKQKCKANTDIDPREPRKTRQIRIDYKYLENPFHDEKKAGIAVPEKRHSS